MMKQFGKSRKLMIKIKLSALRKKLTIVIIIMTIMPVSSAVSQSFSCSFGKQAACLDYGDKICSSMGKCVSDDAVCFDSYTCGFGGFVCKSSLEELADDYDNLRDECNNIIDNYNDLRSQNRSIVDEFNDLNSEYKIISNRLRDTRDEIFMLQRCVQSSTTLEEALSC